VFFTQNGDIDVSDADEQNVDTGGNISFIEAGQTVTSSNSGIPANTTVTSINSSTGDIVLSADVTGVDATDVTLTFASDDIKCNYIRKPADPNWTYTVVVGKALHNASASDLQNFELHASEETSLVLKILQLAGVSIKDTLLIQTASTAENSNVQQEKL
jgi:hypothetical protein